MTKLKLEVGKYYRTRDGRKVGPLEYADFGLMGVGGLPQYYTRESAFFKEEGRTTSWVESPNDLIAEWTYTPSLKIGDKVKVVANSSCHGFEVGSVVTCSHLTSSEIAHFKDSRGIHWSMHPSEYEAIPTTNAISTLDEIGGWGNTPAMGTLAAIGAQVGDVVEYVAADSYQYSWHIGSKWEVVHDGVQKIGSYHHFYKHVPNHYRIISRASDAKSPVDLSVDLGEAVKRALADPRPCVSMDDANEMIDRVLSATAGPVQLRKVIVPGVYGRLHIQLDPHDSDYIRVGLANRLGEVSEKFPSHGLSRADLIAARDVFNALIDAMSDSSQF